MAITYIDNPSSKIEYLDQQESPYTGEKGLFGQRLKKGNSDPSKYGTDFERGSTYPNQKMTDAAIPDYLAAEAIVTAPKLAFNIGRAGIGGIKKIAGRIQSIRNAPAALEEALGSAAEKFGTTETPSMVGNTARTSMNAETSLEEALAQKLYGQVPKDVSVGTPRLSARYQELADELTPGLGNAIKKNIQLEANPIRPNDVGTTNTKILGMSMPDKTPIIPYQYSASPGVPSQLPPNTPPVGDLIKLRSKLGAATRGGGIEGFNAGSLKSALDEDIANIGTGEGPLGKMTNEAVNEPLKRATSYYRDLMGKQGTPLFKKLSDGKLEDIPNIIFKGGRTQDVLEARAILGDQGFNAAKKSFFNDIVNSDDVSKAIAKYGKSNSDFLPSVFNEGELNSIKTIADLQQKATDAAKIVSRAKMLMTGAGAGAAALVGGKMAGKPQNLGLTRINHE